MHIKIALRILVKALSFSIILLTVFLISTAMAQYVSPGKRAKQLYFTNESNRPFFQIWGGDRELEGDVLNNPTCLAIGPDGSLYVSVSHLHVVKQFTKEGAFIRQFGGLGTVAGQFYYPGSIAVSGNGEVYVADNVQLMGVETNIINIFTADGKFVRSWGSRGTGDGQLLGIGGIAISDNGEVFVSDSGNDRIQVFDKNGNFLRKWGDMQHGPKELAVSDGKVYVLVRNSVHYFTADGNFVRRWGNWGPGDGQFKKPAGITVSGNGEVYVADTGQFRVQVFDSDGVYVRQWGHYGKKQGAFHNPRGIDASSGGHVFVSDADNDNIQVFDTNGQFVRWWGTPEPPGDPFDEPQCVAVSGAGEVFLTDTGTHSVKVFDSDGKFLRQWGGEYGKEDGQLAFPHGVATYNDEVFVVDQSNNRIQVFDKDGNYLRKWGELGLGDGEFYFPEGIDISSNGKIYVADTNRDRIQVFNTDGTFVRKWGKSGSGNGQFNKPKGIAVSNGEVYVTDDSRVQVFTRKGKFIRKWGNWGSGDGQLKFPTGISISPDGNVYVVDTENHRIQIFKKGGQFLGKIGKLGGSEGHFLYPSDITIDASGRMYVADKRNSRVQIVNAGQGYNYKGDTITLSGSVKGALARDLSKLMALVSGKDKNDVKFYGLAGIEQSGKYRFLNFPKNARYSVRLVGVNSYVYKQSPRFRVNTSGKQTVKRFLLKLWTKTGIAATGVPISGFITDENGNGIGEVKVRAGGTEVLSDAGGKYAIMVPGQSTVEVRVSKKGYRFKPSSKSVLVKKAEVRGVNFTTRAS